MICPTCERETAAVSELGEMNGGRMRKRCAHPDCKAALPHEAPPPRQTVTLTEEGTLLNIQAPKLAPAQANGAPPSFAQIVAQSEARLLQVRSRLAELVDLQKEEKQLLLILAAAGKAVPETKPS